MRVFDSLNLAIPQSIHRAIASNRQDDNLPNQYFWDNYFQKPMRSLGIRKLNLKLHLIISSNKQFYVIIRTSQTSELFRDYFDVNAFSKS